MCIRDSFNLLRSPAIQEGSLDLMPAGAAVFAVATVNPESEAARKPLTDGSGRRAVTLMDLGHELFANIEDASFFVMPQADSTPLGELPRAALALRVNDPSQSRDLIRFAFDTVQSAAANLGMKVQGPEPVAMGEDVTAERLTIEGFPILLATRGDRLVVSASQQLVTESLSPTGSSVRTDSAFQAALSRDSVSRIVGVQLGRAGEIALALAPKRQVRQMQSWVSMLRGSSVGMSVRHTATTLCLSARVSGIPSIEPTLRGLVRSRKVSSGVPPGRANGRRARRAH